MVNNARHFFQRAYSHALDVISSLRSKRWNRHNRWHDSISNASMKLSVCLRSLLNTIVNLFWISSRVYWINSNANEPDFLLRKYSQCIFIFRASYHFHLGSTTVTSAFLHSHLRKEYARISMTRWNVASWAWQWKYWVFLWKYQHCEQNVLLARIWRSFSISCAPDTWARTSPN